MFPILASISDEHYEATVVVEKKSYITAKIAWDAGATSLYWQLVDPEFSLLELGFEWPSGRLVKCAVPLFNGEVEDKQSESLPSATPGTPFFDLSLWTVDTTDPAARGNHLDEPGRIRLVKKNGGLSIICMDSFPVSSVVYAEKLICDFGPRGELIAITLVGHFPL